MYPEHDAKVLVALALIGGTPTKSSAGKVMKLPPPAIEFNTPPKKPAPNRNKNSNNTLYRAYGHIADKRNTHAGDPIGIVKAVFDGKLYRFSSEDVTGVLSQHSI
jgi:hypothetical protein